MELLTVMSSLIISDLRINYTEMLDIVIRCIIKITINLAKWIIYPIIRIQRKKRRYCPTIENEILLTTATELARRIRKKQITSEEVISTFIDRCKAVNPIVNAIVEDRFKTALEEARKVDKFLENTMLNEEKIAQDMPLLGLPITVKESIAVRGLSYAVGVKIEKDRKADDDADVVKRVRKAGGIPILVSNTPELCMFWESANNITGRTLNPYDTRRTAGGSSGGEAALLGSGASILSLSSDVAGSARLPAMFCGVFGHKPTPNWISCKGHRPNSTDKCWTSVFSICPMTRYAVDLPLLLKVMSPADQCIESLNQKVDLRNVKFFYVENIDSCTFTTTVDEEIKLAIHNLLKHVETTYGSSVHKMKSDNLRSSFEMAALNLMRLNKVETIFNLGDGDKPWKNLVRVFFERLFLFSAYTWTSILFGFVKKLTLLVPKSYTKDMSKKHALLKTEFQEALGHDGVLIYPCFSSPAHYHNETYYKIVNVCFITIFNTLGLPVTQCPVRLNKNGLPVGLQVIANKGCDHLSIAVAKEIERKFGGWRKPPSENETT